MSRPGARSLLGLAALVLTVHAASQWWSARHQAQLGEQAASLARAGDIRMLSSETCAICASARIWFTENRIPFSECLIERDASCRADFQASGAPGTPVLQVRGRSFVGFAPGLVLEALRRDS
jgi:hypothetical protein